MKKNITTFLRVTIIVACSAGTPLIYCLERDPFEQSKRYAETLHETQKAASERADRAFKDIERMNRELELKRKDAKVTTEELARKELEIARKQSEFLVEDEQATVYARQSLELNNKIGQLEEGLKDALQRNPNPADRNKVINEFIQKAQEETEKVKEKLSQEIDTLSKNIEKSGVSISIPSEERQGTLRERKSRIEHLMEGMRTWFAERAIDFWNWATIPEIRAQVRERLSDIITSLKDTVINLSGFRMPPAGANAQQNANESLRLLVNIGESTQELFKQGYSDDSPEVQALRKQGEAIAKAMTNMNRDSWFTFQKTWES